MDKRFCIYCGKRIPPDSVFCDGCGMKQPPKGWENETPSTAYVAPAPKIVQAAEPVSQKPPKKPFTFPLANVIRNSILILVSLVMLILAFCPILSFGVEYEGFEVNVELSAVDQVTILFDSFKSLDEDELTETRLYEKLEEMAWEFDDFFYEDGLEPSDSALDRFGKMAFILTRLYAQSEEYTAPAAYYVSSLICIIYIINAIALLVFAVLNLLASLKLLGGIEGEMFKWTVRALTLTPVLLVASFFTISISMCEGAGSSMCDAAIDTLFLSITAIIAVFVLRMVFTKREERLCPIPRAIAAALAVIVMCLSFAPALNATVTTTFSGDSKEKEVSIGIGAAFFVVNHTNETMKDELNERFENYTTEQKAEFLNSIFAQFKNLDRNEAEGVFGVAVNNSLLVSLIGVKTQKGVLDLISLIGILFIGALAGAGLILWQNASYFANGEYSTKIVVIGKIVSAACASLALAASIVYLAIVKALQGVYLPSGYEISISAGVIFLAIFAIGSIFCPHKVAPRVAKSNVKDSAPAAEDFTE